MRKYSSNLAFVDLLFNLLIGFASLFVIAFLMINPIAKTGAVTPPTRMIVELTWDNESSTDLDIHIVGPNGQRVYYAAKDGRYFILERDDLGSTNDTYVINGEVVKIRRNYEIVSFTELPPGEYVVNVHHFSANADPEEATVRVTMISPYEEVFTGNAVVAARQEVTLVSFTVDAQGKIVDMRTDLQIPVARRY